METIMVDAPNCLEASCMNSGRCIAAVLRATLSAPCLNMVDMSSNVLRPPPTIKGMNISLAVNENMSVSYGVSSVDFEAASKSDEDSSGISASYTTGGMTLSVVSNKTDAVAGTAASDKEYKEVSVSFAF